MTRGLMALALALLLAVWQPWPTRLGLYLAWALLGLLLWRHRRGWAFCLWLMLLGYGYATHWVNAIQAHRVPLSMVGTVQALTVRVEAVTPTRFGGQQLRVRVVATPEDLGWRPRALSLRDASAQDWPLGSVWAVAVTLNAPIGRLNPVGFEAGLAAVVAASWRSRGGLSASSTTWPARGLGLGPRRRHGLSV